MNTRKKSLVVLFFAFLVGFGLRFYKLDSFPLYGDELTMVYDSYSLLKTGKDQLGNYLPLTFRMGAGRPAGYIYFSIPFVALFGPSAWGVRSLSFLSGLGIMILMYLLGKKLFGIEVGVVVFIFTAISLWDISLSRVGLEAHFALFLALLGVISLLYSKGKPWLYLLFSLSWGVAIHTYPVYKLVLFLFLPFLLFYIWEDAGVSLKERRFILPVLVSVFFGILAISFSVNESLKGVSEERFLSLNVFSRSDIRGKIVSEVMWERGFVELLGIAKTLLSNKFFYYLKLLISSYLGNFSTNFLFVSGDGIPVHNLFELGQMYYIDFFLLIVGLIYLGYLVGRSRVNKLILLILSWLLIAPLGSFLLLEQHALRNSFMLPPLLLIISLGLFCLWKLRKRLIAKLSLIFVFVSIFFQLIFGVARALFLLPYKSADSWSFQAKEVVNLALEVKDNYDSVFISNTIDNIEYAYEVYARVDPREAQKQNQGNLKFKGFWFRKFDNVFIIDVPKEKLEDFLEDCNGKCLFIADSVSFKDKLVNYEVVDFRSGVKPVLVKEF